MNATPETPEQRTARLARLDHAHVWHPFTAMRPWREAPPLIIQRGQGPHLFDTSGKRYLDGVSSLWCNVHGHAVPEIDAALRAQLDQIAHSTLLGLASPPSIELAARLTAIAPREENRPGLNKVFYSDAGATAVEAALKMAVGYWFHRGRPEKRGIIALAGAYHGDTTGGMSVGYSELFHRPFASMVFPATWFAAPDACRPPQGWSPASRPSGADARGQAWPSANAAWVHDLEAHCLRELAALLEKQAHQTAALIFEPLMQGAAGMTCQSPGFLRQVIDLARHHQVLAIADEVATGFGRTGSMFACEQAPRTPDLLCLGKGISGGYLPLAATLATDEVEDAFCGELAEKRTFFHGHTYTGNALACAAGIASLDLFTSNHLLEHIAASADIIRERLAVLHEHPNVLDVRQRGLMVGVELCHDRRSREPFDFSKRTGAALCAAMRPKGLIIRPLGDVLVLMPIPAMPHAMLHEMLDIFLGTLGPWRAR